MSRLKSYRPSAPVVINLIALFIVLGGQAVALQGGGRVTRNDIAPGAVTARNLANGIVTTTHFGRHAVKSAKLADDAISGRAIHPGSVHGRALRATIQIPATIQDLDPNGDPGEFNWTDSTGAASCPKGMRLLNGGISIRDSATHRGFVQSTSPSLSNSSTWLGAITTNTGGLSPGTLYAHCLR
jgi:hypothetical protein